MLNKIIVASAIFLLAVSNVATATPPGDTLSIEAREAIMADIVAKSDSLDQESFTQWLYQQGKQAETKNLFTAQIFYDTYLTALNGSVILEYAIPTTYDRTSVWQKVTANIKDVQRFAIKSGKEYPKLRRTIYNFELFAKSLQLRSARTIEKKLANIGDSELTAHWELAKEHREAFEILHSFIIETQPDIDRKRIAALPQDTAKIHEFDFMNGVREQLDSTIRISEAHIISEIYLRDTSGVAAALDFKWNVVQSGLNDDNAIVEYMTCPDDNGDMLYYAIVATNEMQYPAIVTIGAEKELYNCLEGKINYVTLYEILWAPLQPLIDKRKEIYVIPAGIIHRVPFAGLYDGREFLYDRYTIHHCLSGRDVTDGRKDDVSFPRKNILLVGGADYDIMPTGDSTLNETELKLAGARRSDLRDALSSTRGQGFSYLPGSLTEVNSVAHLLSGKGWNVESMTDIHATKTELHRKIELMPADILHISTHGFSIRTPADDTSSDRNIYKVSDNPLLRSGLAFSGANLNWKKRDKLYVEDDGILTALEISRLNLAQTKLVVLSACGTGLGYVANGEGIYGMQRAFRLAGVDKIIVSLWDIPDNQTSELMIAFYRHIADGYPIKQSFDMAIKQARGKYRDRLDFWAGFILIE